jgi:hypothetical protein
MMLIEAAYPKRLGTPRRRRIKAEETSASAVSMTSSSLVVRSAALCRRPSGFFAVTQAAAPYLIAAPCAWAKANSTGAVGPRAAEAVAASELALEIRTTA